MDGTVDGQDARPLAGRLVDAKLFGRAALAEVRADHDELGAVPDADDVVAREELDRVGMVPRGDVFAACKVRRVSRVEVSARDLVLVAVRVDVEEDRDPS